MPSRGFPDCRLDEQTANQGARQALVCITLLTSSVMAVLWMAAREMNVCEAHVQVRSKARQGKARQDGGSVTLIKRVKPKPPKLIRAGSSRLSAATQLLSTNTSPDLLPPPPSPPPNTHCAAAPPFSPPPTLVPHTAAMFKQLIPRASTRGALSSGFQSAQALRSTAPSTTLIQQRIWQRRGYATETGTEQSP